MRSTSRAPVAQTVLPGEIWEDILLRLDAAADLARASAACSSFRRIVSERRFLRRFLSLHSPAVLGLISRRGHQFVPVEPPHRSAPEARALEQAADFTFSFLPNPSRWCFRHALLDGRVLLAQRISSKTQFEDFLVCDPLYRRYVKIPRIPDDPLAACPAPDNGMSQHVLPVLAPDEEESFKIICTVQFKHKVVAFVFSSCNQTWRYIIWVIEKASLLEYMPDYAHGCFYWMVFRKGYSIMLDTSEMKFSIINLLPHNFDSERAIVEAEEGKLGFLTIVDGTIDLYCKNPSIGVGSQEWLHNKLIPLPKESGINWVIVGTTGHYLALEAYHGIWDELPPKSEYFVLDMKTLLVEKLCTSNNGFNYDFPYARFPPPFAMPSI